MTKNTPASNHLNSLKKIARILNTYGTYYAKSMGSTSGMKWKIQLDIGCNDVKILDSTDLWEYQDCCVQLFKIQLFIHVVKHIKLNEWAFKQEKNRFTDALFLDRAHFHDRSIGKISQGTAKHQDNIAPFTQSLAAVNWNTNDWRKCGRYSLAWTVPNKCLGYNIQSGMCGHKPQWLPCAIPVSLMITFSEQELLLLQERA